jgi:hypothetical protein
MANKALEWDKTATREFESGVSKVALYPIDPTGAYGDGVAWSGVTGIDENPSGADATDLYADDIKYATLRSAEKFDFTISAYDYPPEWAACDGSAEVEGLPGVYIGQQGRQAFGLVYETKIGDDTHPGMDKGKKIHIIYNSTASPSARSYATINENPDAITFSWSASSTPASFGTNSTYKPTCSIVVESTVIGKTKFEALEKKLYGDDGDGDQDPGNKPTFLEPAALISFLQSLT